jgi:DNA-binding response OmpR family regulator
MAPDKLAHLLLIAEEDRPSADRLATQMRDAGWQVESISNVTKAVTEANTLLPSAILLSMAVSDGPGFAVVNRLRRHPVLKHARLVLALSGDDAAAVVAQHAKLSTRADAYLVGPVTDETLMPELERLMDEDRLQVLERFYLARERSPSLSAKGIVMWLVLLAILIVGLRYAWVVFWK